jgi:hypothetical protein
MIGLPSPLFERDQITTLIGPDEAEMAALVAALAVSWRSGVQLIPGFVPEGPSELAFYPYRGTWIDWRILVADICSANDIAPPSLYLRCPSDPLTTALAAPRDPDASAYWHPLLEADIEADIAAASAAGHRLPPVLTVVFGVQEAAGAGDGAVERLYQSLAGKTVLAVTGTDVPDNFGDFGPVIEMPPMHDSMLWRDVLARVTGGFWPEGEQVMVDRALDEDAVHPERTWNEARQRGREIAPPTSELGTLFGFASVYNQWKEVNHWRQGHFLERVAPGAFTKAIAERPRMKVTFRHGQDPRFGFRSLGTLTVLEESEFGVWYEVELVDGDHTRALVPGLLAGEYRSSFTYEVLSDHVVKNPGPSEHNPFGLPEVTVFEVRCSELGPCRNPAFAGTSAGIRLAV